MDLSDNWCGDPLDHVDRVAAASAEAMIADELAAMGEGATASLKELTQAPLRMLRLSDANKYRGDDNVGSNDANTNDTTDELFASVCVRAGQSTNEQPDTPCAIVSFAFYSPDCPVSFELSAPEGTLHELASGHPHAFCGELELLTKCVFRWGIPQAQPQAKTQVRAHGRVFVKLTVTQVPNLAPCSQMTTNVSGDAAVVVVVERADGGVGCGGPGSTNVNQGKSRLISELCEGGAEEDESKRTSTSDEEGKEDEKDEDDEGGEGGKEARMRARLQEMMRRYHANNIIRWKREHANDDPSPSYEDFIVDQFPENATVTRDEVTGQTSVVLDERVQGDAWRGAFDQLSAGDALYEDEVSDLELMDELGVGSNSTGDAQSRSDVDDAAHTGLGVAESQSESQSLGFFSMDWSRFLGSGWGRAQQTEEVRVEQREELSASAAAAAAAGAAVAAAAVASAASANVAMLLPETTAADSNGAAGGEMLDDDVFVVPSPHIASTLPAVASQQHLHAHLNLLAALVRRDVQHTTRMLVGTPSGGSDVGDMAPPAFLDFGVCLRPSTDTAAVNGGASRSAAESSDAVAADRRRMQRRHANQQQHKQHNATPEAPPIPQGMRLDEGADAVAAALKQLLRSRAGRIEDHTEPRSIERPHVPCLQRAKSRISPDDPASNLDTSAWPVLADSLLKQQMRAVECWTEAVFTVPVDIGASLEPSSDDASDESSDDSSSASDVSGRRPLVNRVDPHAQDAQFVQFVGWSKTKRVVVLIHALSSESHQRLERVVTKRMRHRIRFMATVAQEEALVTAEAHAEAAEAAARASDRAAAVTVMHTMQRRRRLAWIRRLRRQLCRRAVRLRASANRAKRRLRQALDSGEAPSGGAQARQLRALWRKRAGAAHTAWATQFARLHVAYVTLTAAGPCSMPALQELLPSMKLSSSRAVDAEASEALAASSEAGRLRLTRVDGTLVTGGVAPVVTEIRHGLERLISRASTLGLPCVEVVDAGEEYGGMQRKRAEVVTRCLYLVDPKDGSGRCMRVLQTATWAVPVSVPLEMPSDDVADVSSSCRLQPAPLPVLVEVCNQARPSAEASASLNCSNCPPLWMRPQCLRDAQTGAVKTNAIMRRKRRETRDRQRLLARMEVTQLQQPLPRSTLPSPQLTNAHQIQGEKSATSAAVAAALATAVPHATSVKELWLDTTALRTPQAIASARSARNAEALHMALLATMNAGDVSVMGDLVDPHAVLAPSSAALDQMTSSTGHADGVMDRGKGTGRRSSSEGVAPLLPILRRAAHGRFASVPWVHRTSGTMCALLPAVAVASATSHKPQVMATTVEGERAGRGAVSAKTVSVVFLRTSGVTETPAPGQHARTAASPSAATALLQFSVRWNARGYVYGMSVRAWPPRLRLGSRHDSGGDASKVDVLQDTPRLMRFVHRSYVYRTQQAVDVQAAASAMRSPLLILQQAARRPSARPSAAREARRSIENEAMNSRIALARLQGRRDSEKSSGESTEEGSSGDTSMEEEVEGDSAHVTSDDDDDEFEEEKDSGGAIAHERPVTAAAVDPDRLAAFRGLLLRGISVELCDTHGYRHSRPVLAARRLKKWIATRRGEKRLHYIRMKQIRLLGTRVADSLADALARARENALMARKHALNARKHAMWLATNAKKHATNVGLHAMAAGRTIATSLTVLSAEDHAALRAQARRHHKMHWKRRTFFLRHGPRGAELRWQRPGKSTLKQSARRTAVLADVRNVGLANIGIGSNTESVALTLANKRVLHLRWRTAAEAAVAKTLFEALLAGGGGSACIDQ